ncbi:MAG: hypothetical protein MUP08_08295 [Desulfobulbaceae bacterium]|nr:hypothetical protein [Desulfobulbaceae bacterium]
MIETSIGVAWAKNVDIRLIPVCQLQRLVQVRRQYLMVKSIHHTVMG